MSLARNGWSPISFVTTLPSRINHARIRANTGRLRSALLTSAAAGGSMGYLDELIQLASSHEQGILTDAEFDAKKKQILDAN